MRFLKQLSSITQYNIKTYQLVLELDQVHIFPCVDATITRQTVAGLKLAAELIAVLYEEYEMRNVI